MLFEHEQERAAANAERQKVFDAYRRLFQSPDGAVVLHDLIQTGKVFQGTATDVEEGMRFQTLYILRMSGVEEKIQKLIGAIYV
ncbi:MAG: hypothetical protein PHI86_06070 [Candidatus Omnitrophica bacterium]|nr:hypothetical protein [Candidatus Omnitrophota bacterium]